MGTACLTVAMAFVGLHPSGFKANYMDLSQHSTGLLSGLGNTVASMASFVGPVVVGEILARYKSWTLVFAVVGLVQVVAAVVFGTLSRVEPIDAQLYGAKGNSALKRGKENGEPGNWDSSLHLKG